MLFQVIHYISYNIVLRMFNGQTLSLSRYFNKPSITITKYQQIRVSCNIYI